MSSYSLNAKIGLVVAVVSIACGAISFKSARGFSQAETDMDLVVNKQVVRMNYWRDLRGSQSVLTIREREIIISKDAGERAELEAKMLDVKKKMDETRDKLVAIEDEEAKAKASEHKEVMASWWATHDRVRALKEEGKADEAMNLASGDGQKTWDKAAGIVEERVKFAKAAMQAEVESMHEHAIQNRRFIVGLALGAVAFALGLAFFFMRQISRSIGQVIDGFESNSTRMMTTSKRVGSSADGLSSGVSQQASALQQTAAAIEELSQMVQRNTESAQRSSQLSQTSQGSAMRGQEVVTEMSNAISEIDESNRRIMARVEEGNRKIGDITKVIAGIADKTRVINDIVFQTKLLSFNASVEAARAGEHGKGFAVVAEEVGNLAQMSGNAAKEISAMLEESIDTVDRIVQEMRSQVEGEVHAGRSKVEAGTRIVEECGAVLGEIVEQVSEATRMSNDIASASKEQAQGVQEISRAMSQLEQVTQANSAGAEQAAEVASALTSQAQELEGLVGELITAIRGANRGSQGSEASVVERAAASSDSGKEHRFKRAA